MTEITIHVPNRLRPYIAAKVKQGFESVENYLLSLIEAEQLQEAHASDVLDTMTRSERARLNAILLERSQGPFVKIDPFDEDFWNDLRDECRAHAGLKAPRHA